MTNNVMSILPQEKLLPKQASTKQEVFSEGYVRAFEHFGGVSSGSVTTISRLPSKSYSKNAFGKNSVPTPLFAALPVHKSLTHAGF